MLFLLVSCLSFLLLSKSFFLKPRPNSKPMWVFWEVFRRFCIIVSCKRRVFIRAFHAPKSFPKVGIQDEVKVEEGSFPLLDLPDLALDCILDKLLPAELCRMSGVCTSLREKCTSDYLWEKHLSQKWGGVIGDVAFKEWQSQRAAPPKLLHCRARRGRFLSFLFGFFGQRSVMKRLDNSRISMPNNSVMSCYLALESGKFWFPAQVFNRENGHVGFMLSCYDAKLSYDSTRDNFIARYPAQGRTVIEEGIKWDRMRAPCVNTPANVLHISKCLDELKPGDHIEIQWRKNKEFPYGWWYGVVDHLDSCGGNQLNCHCHFNDTVTLEFKQYSEGSRWRRVVIRRNDHREVGNEAEGFYGGIRKLCRKEEVAEWKHFWPNCTLE